MSKIKKTPMLGRYLIKLVIRAAIFLWIFVIYVTHKEWLINFATAPLAAGITLLHILWLIFMVMMLGHIFPHERLSMALRKSQPEVYEEVPGYSRLELLEYVQDQNLKAWKVMLLWLFVNGIIGGLYLTGVLDNSEILLIIVFFFLCDYVCILFFCPFQTCVIKNKCCINCRIFDWGHFMMFFPALFIRSFYTWSLFFVSATVLLRWEIIYAKHPERYWGGSNKKLQCSSCKDKTCQIKNLLAKKPAED